MNLEKGFHSDKFHLHRTRYRESEGGDGDFRMDFTRYPTTSLRRLKNITRIPTLSLFLSLFLSYPILLTRARWCTHKKVSKMNNKYFWNSIGIEIVRIKFWNLELVILFRSYDSHVIHKLYV